MYAIAGIAIESSATTSAAPRGISIRPSRYTGTAARHITTTFRNLIASYAPAVEWIHQAGAIRYE